MRVYTFEQPGADVNPIDTLSTQVSAPAFMAKLASAGTRVKSQEEVLGLMDKAAAVRAAVEAVVDEIMDGREDPIKSASDALTMRKAAQPSAAEVGAKYLALPGVRDAALAELAAIKK